MKDKNLRTVAENADTEEFGRDRGSSQLPINGELGARFLGGYYAIKIGTFLDDLPGAGDRGRDRGGGRGEDPTCGNKKL